MERLAGDKQSNLLCQFVSYEENEVLWMRALDSMSTRVYRLAKQEHSSLFVRSMSCEEDKFYNNGHMVNRWRQ